MLLLIFSTGQGTFIWYGPSKGRIAYVEPEYRVARVVS